MEREELADWLRLAATPLVGNLAGRKLLSAFGLPPQIFSQPLAALRQVVGDAQANNLLTAPPELPALVETTWQWLAQDDGFGQRRIITLADPSYPPGLLRTEDPPVMLYVMGAAVQEWPRAIAMVGSRNPSAQGAANARQFAQSLAQSGLTIVSGLALGVDGAAHEGALAGAVPGQLATIAVVGTGLDRVYPRQHHALAREISQRGLLVSEYPLGTPPLAQNFPKRNRIIAALSEGTLVVEAALKSGSLITAGQAVEQGKDVFAIPGSIHSAQSRGCHLLIRQGAKLVETAQDVLEELAPGFVPQPPSRASAQADSADPDRADADSAPDGSVLQALGYDPVGLDALMARTGMDAAALQAQLLELELAGDVGRLPGGLFQRIGNA